MTADAGSTAVPLSRPVLVPGLRRLWRSRHHLQLGVDPVRAVVLELPDPGVARMLDLLDGTRSHRTILSQAERLGVSGSDAGTVIDHLRACGLLLSAQALLPSDLPHARRSSLATEAAALAMRPGDTRLTPAQRLRRRATARVVVTGGGPLAGAIAVTLARSGVGHVVPDFTQVAEHDETAAAIAREAPGTLTRPVRRTEASFVVQVGHHGPPALVAAGFAQRRLPHLAVSVRDGTAIVGPLVPPAGMPCLNCVDLHRRDRDPDWPELTAQLATTSGPEPCAAATVLTAAGLATGDVLTWLDGSTPASLGMSIEIDVGAPRRRSWPPHPHCPCVRRHRGRPAAPAIRPPTGPAGTDPERPRPGRPTDAADAGGGVAGQ
jgi:bacteriocin biosynthesis cyclodehydratase domain-containing protein